MGLASLRATRSIIAIGAWIVKVADDFCEKDKARGREGVLLHGDAEYR